MNGVPFTSSWKESKKNCITFLIGANLHLFFYLIIQKLADRGGFAKMFYNFYYVFFLIDLITMAIIYKCYWGRSILHEIEEEDDKHVFDEKTHKYVNKRIRHEDIVNENIERFYDKAQDLEQLDNKVKELEKTTEEIQEAVYYAPGGPAYEEAKTEFETLQTSHFTPSTVEDDTSSDTSSETK